MIHSLLKNANAEFTVEHWQLSYNAETQKQVLGTTMVDASDEAIEVKHWQLSQDAETQMQVLGTTMVDNAPAVALCMQPSLFVNNADWHANPSVRLQLHQH